MKNLLAIVFVYSIGATCGMSVFADDESTGAKLGIQMYSDSFAGFLYYSQSFELGLKASAVLYDSDSQDGDLLFGAHLAYVFHTSEPSSAISIGVDAGSYIGDISYEEYVDIGIRIGFNHLVGKHFLISGLFFPMYISTRDIEGISTFSLQAVFPKAAVALAYLF